MKGWEIFYHSEKGFLTQENEGPRPLLGNEVLIEVDEISVCGSDLHAISLYKGEYLYLGHEWKGRVVHQGMDVQKLSKGDIVTSGSVIGCGHCHYCQDGLQHYCESSIRLGGETVGALAKYLILPESNLVKIPQELESAAIVAEPLAVAQESLHRLSSIGVAPHGKKVIILGGGAIGFLTAWLFKKKRAEVLVLEPVAERRERFKAIGVEAILPALALTDPSLKNSADIVIDAAGDFQSTKSAFAMIPFLGKKPFTALLVGKYAREQVLHTSLFRTRHCRMIWQDGLASHTIEEVFNQHGQDLKKLKELLITHQFQVGQVREAFEMAKNRSESLKVLIKLT